MIRKLLTIALFTGFVATAEASVDFFDDFENGLSEWTVGGRQLGGPNIAGTELRHGSTMGHLYKYSFTEITLDRAFEYDPSLRFVFDMEVTASSQSPPAPNYYGSASARFLFYDDQRNHLGTVGYMTATTSYPFDQAQQTTTTSYNQVPSDVLEHYQITVTDLLAQIDIEEVAIREVVVQFNCYSSTYPYPAVSAELWVDDLTVTTCQDNDGDEICDVDDNCPDAWNPDQADADRDLIGNSCDPAFDVAILQLRATVSTATPGSRLSFDIRVANNTGSPQQADLWFEVGQPAGSTLLVPANLLCLPTNPFATTLFGALVEQGCYLDIPPGTVPGTYTLVGLGGVFPSLIVVQDSLEILVSP